MKTLSTFILLFVSTQVFALRYGKLTANNQFPSSVFFRNCGSVKLTVNSLLTAAHCIVDEKTGQKFAEYKPNSIIKVRNEAGDFLDLEIEKSIVHTSYQTLLEKCKSRNECLDLAVVRIKKEVLDFESFQEIPIAKIANSISPKEAIHVTGAGRELPSESFQMRLEGLQIVSQEIDDFMNFPHKVYPVTQYSLLQKKLVYRKTIFYQLEDLNNPFITPAYETEDPLLQRGDSGTAAYNAKGEVLGINSSVDLAQSKSFIIQVTKKSNSGSTWQWIQKHTH